MSTLEIIADKLREDSEASFAKESEAVSLNAGQAQVKPMSPLDFNGD